MMSEFIGLDVLWNGLYYTCLIDNGENENVLRVILQCEVELCWTRCGLKK
jgi:hypothetical protein